MVMGGWFIVPVCSVTHFVIRLVDPTDVAHALTFLYLILPYL